MKFVCRNCETFMLFQHVEKPEENSLGITFECPNCKAKFSMVTNPGETQLVHALGVKLGGSVLPSKPLELTRETLKDSSDQDSVYSKKTKDLGNCPFADLVVEMESSVTKNPSEANTFLWTETALKRLNNIPEFVRSFAKNMMEKMAKEQGKTCVDDEVMDQAKEKFM